MVRVRGRTLGLCLEVFLNDLFSLPPFFVDQLQPLLVILQGPAPCQCLVRYFLCQTRLVHLDVEECSEELLRQQSYAIKNQLGHPKPPLGALALELWMPELVLYGKRLLGKQFL